MPTYEYVCRTCGAEFEVFQSIKAEPLRECGCGQRGFVERKIGRGAAILFKGTGFYETDYKRPAASKAVDSSSSAASSVKSSSEGSPAPAQPAAPPTPAQKTGA